MPVRSLSSSVLKWPDARTVDRAVHRWAEQVVRGREDVLRIGYFGSYARGDWGVGSDLDLVIVVRHSDCPRERRAVEWDTGALPVPADVLVYTAEEWAALNDALLEIPTGQPSQRGNRCLPPTSLLTFNFQLPTFNLQPDRVPRCPLNVFW